ncbi:hypothetical protein [uncultured Desulfovibrio sp.]|uniref:hypothetical protein n=1 Tax=uncultured Desulfovibrio sp. TaxID=167968 RepID=UPI00260661D2|nr:hypothetical protein [uncultured Desulfovibrio sp.]
MPEERSPQELAEELMRPLMAYAELLKAAGHPAQSRLVWALLENHFCKLVTLLEQVRQQVPDLTLDPPSGWKM